MISGYRRVIEAEKAWEGKKILLTIDGAAHDSEVFLNGRKWENITVDTQLLRWISAEYSAMEKKISLS